MIYILIFMFIAFSTIMDLEKRKIWILGWMVFCFFYILRTRIGTDWPVYENYYKSLSSNSEVIRLNFEKGYYWLNMLFYTLHFPFQIIPVMISSIVCIAFYYGTKRYDFKMGLTLLASLYYLFYPTLEALRQSVAVFLFYYSLSYLIRNAELSKNNILKIMDSAKFWLLNIIGALFHQTVGIFVVLFYFFIRNKMFKLIVTILLVSFKTLQPYIEIVMEKYFPSVFHKYIYYVISNGNNKWSFISAKFIEYIIIMIILLLIKNKNENEKMAMNLIEIGLLIQFSLIGVLDSVYRMLYYTDIGIVLFISSFDQRIKKWNFKLFYRIMVIAYIGLHLYRSFPVSNDLFKYHMLW